VFYKSVLVFLSPPPERTCFHFDGLFANIIASFGRKALLFREGLLFFEKGHPHCGKMVCWIAQVVQIWCAR